MPSSPVTAQGQIVVINTSGGTVSYNTLTGQTAGGTGSSLTPWDTP
ncbi:MAG: hypothetical protein ABTQ25_15195 [Nitrosomonas ureae]